MPTTIHLPDELLAEVDKRAKALRLSRNGFIRRAVEKALEDVPNWSPEFMDQLATFEPLDDASDLRPVIQRARRSKKAPPL